MQAHDRDSRYVSQSETKDAHDCGVRWFGSWGLNYRPQHPESLPQRVGSLGHAALAGSMLSRGRDWAGTTAVMLDEAKKRGYLKPDATEDDIDDDLRRDMDAAARAAELMLSSLDFNPGAIAIAPDGTPLIEHRIRATWGMLAKHAGLHLPDGMLRVFHGQRVGMEGQPDICHEYARTLYVDDFKMRQKPDLGGTIDDLGGPILPDLQGSFYKVLLKAVRVGIGKEVIFRQLNVYAGAWLSLDDFLADGSSYVTSHGLPSRDDKKLGACVTADVWAEAWRTLVERRRVESTNAVTTTGKPKPIRMASPAEMRDAEDFIDTLRRQKLVHVVEQRLDHTVCVEVVRDMLAPVAGLLAQVSAGIVPGRNLRTYRNAPCSRRFGCPVQDQCIASIGTGQIGDTLRNLAADEIRRRLAVLGTIAERELA